MLHIAINATSISPGGGLTVLVGFLEEWKRIGWTGKITVYASRPQVLTACRNINPNIKLIPFALNASSSKHFMLQQLLLGKIIKKEGADVAYSTQTAIGQCPVPQLIHHQNLHRFQTFRKKAKPGQYELKKYVLDFFAKKAIEIAKCNVFISKYMMDRANILVPGFEYKNYVVYNGISFKYFENIPIKSQPNINPQIFALQNTFEHKDNVTLLQMMVKLRQMDSKTKWKLLIAGSGDWEPYKKVAESFSIQEYVEFIGFLSETQVDKILRNSCCLVYSSIFEGFGLPVIEAMGRGCPVVASGCTALPEIVGEAGILVPPQNADAFARAVICIYNDPLFRANLIEKGYENVSKFSWTKSAKEMIMHFERIAN